MHTIIIGSVLKTNFFEGPPHPKTLSCRHLGSPTHTQCQFEAVIPRLVLALGQKTRTAVSQTRTLDQQVPQSLGDYRVPAVWWWPPLHKKKLRVSSVANPKAAKDRFGCPRHWEGRPQSKLIHQQRSCDAYGISLHLFFQVIFTASPSSAT